MVEGEVALVVQGASVVQGRAVIEFIKGHDVVGVGVGQSEMSDQPTSAVCRDVLANIKSSRHRLWLLLVVVVFWKLT